MRSPFGQSQKYDDIIIILIFLKPFFHLRVNNEARCARFLYTFIHYVCFCTKHCARKPGKVAYKGHNEQRHTHLIKTINMT